MKDINIEERRKKILCSIIESYIDTGIPVGSRAISQRFRWSMSPATIRNVMADLEEMDFITHPHTSAGRVPTDRGYRFYVDCLLEPAHLTKEEESIINKLITKRCEDFESLMHHISRAISMVTNVVGIVLTPRLKRSILKHIELIPIDTSRILAVVITNLGIVRNSTFELDEQLTKSELLRISEFLNQELEGMFLGEIKNYLTRRLLEQHDSFYTFLEKAMRILSMPNLLRMDDKIYLEGVAGLMSYPEFRDVAKVKAFFRVFEEQRDILDLFNEDMEQDGIKVHIGKENLCEHIQNCAVVTGNYKIEDDTIGIVGAIGPTRMEYGKVISTVEYLSEILGKALENLG